MATEETKIILTGEFKNKQAVINALKQVDENVKDISIQSQKTEKQVNSLSSSLKKLAQIVGISVLAKKFVDLGKASLTAAGQMEQYNVAFTTMLGSASNAKVLMEDIINFARKTPFQIEGLVGTTKQLLAYGIEQDKMIDTLSVLGNVAAGVGVPVERLALVFGQVKSTTKLLGQDLNQFTQAGVPLLSELAKMLGKTEAEVISLKESGLISFEMVQQALVNMTSEGGRFFNLMEAQSGTFLGILSNLQDGIFIVKTAIGNALLPVAKTSITAIKTFFDELVVTIGKNSQKIAEFGKKFVENFTIAIKLASFFLKGIYTIVSSPLLRWIGLVTVAMKVLSNVIIKNPIVAAIWAIITVVGYLRDAFNTFSSETQIKLLEIQRAFGDWEQVFIAGIYSMLEALSRFSKIPGLGWTNKWADDFANMTTDITNNLDNLDKRIEELRNKPFEAGQSPEMEAQEAPAVEDNELQQIQEKNDAEFQLESEHQQAIADLQEEFRQGKIDLETLEEEEKQLKYQEDLAKLNEQYLLDQQMVGNNEKAKLELRKKYDAEKDKLDKSRVEKQKFFSKESLDGARAASGQLVALENSKHKELAGIGKAAALVNITIDTARGAIAAYASLAPIPFVGPVLGAAAAAAIIAYGAEQASAASGASFAVGAAEIPQDMNATIHQGEMIIPATFAESIRSGELTLGGQSEDISNQTAEAGIVNNIIFDGANFYGNMDDEMLIEIGTRLGELINEDLLTPIPTRTA